MKTDAIVYNHDRDRTHLWRCWIAEVAPTRGRIQTEGLVGEESLQTRSVVFDRPLPVPRSSSTAHVLILVRSHPRIVDQHARSFRTSAQTVEAQLGTIVTADHVQKDWRLFRR